MKTFIDRLNGMEQVEQLIRLQATGNSREFAEKIGISESTLFKLLNDLRDLGADFKFSSSINSYCYCSSQKFNIGYEFVCDWHAGNRTQ
jgi:hypothetical protein